MRFAQVLLDSVPAVVAQEKGGDWHKLDIAQTMIDILGMKRHLLEVAYKQARPVDVNRMRFCAPISSPPKILAIGHNYTDGSHPKNEIADFPVNPLIFAKLTSSINDPNESIEWDPTVTTAVDYEAELAVVIGAKCKSVMPEVSLQYVFGYTCANDVTARDLQHSDGQWTRGKGLDTFCPLGPWIVTADEIPDPQQLTLRCELNGQLVQNSSTADMIFQVKTIIAYLSQTFTLFPGDVILTGTPDGSGYYRDPKILLKDGDNLVVEIEGIGRLENSCRNLSTNVT